MSASTLWHDFKASQPGRRFQDFYEKRQEDRSDGHGWRRALYVGLGVVIALSGIVLLGMPGPGLLVLALGLALVAGESALMAQGLDRLEVWLRALSQKFIQWWRHLRPYQQYLGIAAVIALALGAAGCVYKVLS
ncbi:hypothetical protein GCM10023213_27860 [Prosthecobacter algae]|uniref:Transmembrane protein PGPGW n=1 Tax=Prosthecobacter algae TaxID=1144682 RepID=A0ABP9P871_9BACT